MEVLEPEHSKRDTFCCGAGGGHMWMRESPGGKLNEVRVKQLVKTDVEKIITACPYCLVMFDDALRSSGADELKRMDLVEILDKAL